MIAERWIAIGVLALSATSGCDTSEHGRSCGGEAVLVCDAYEWANVREASLEPDGLVAGDITMRAHIRVVLDRCERAPAAHDVALSFVVPDPTMGGDAGDGVEVFSVLTLRDGDDGDPVAGDGVIDVDVVNPFSSGVPARAGRARFEAISRGPSGCGSGSLSIPYRVGAP
ncbi:MAG: hypothetical protein AB7S26_34010 [Sandaracinaceae bacterium]